MIQSAFFNLIVFLSAFLLFQLELIVAKSLLPHYGGSYLVWGSSVVFFQAVLLAGYVYAHYVVQKLGISRYRVFHLVLCLFPLFVFPGRSFVIHSSGFGLPLFLDVFVQLAVTIGPVFFVLSTMSIIMQVWFSRSNLPQAANPYPLYSISNLGSFAALLSYPFLFEAQLALSQQLRIWQAGYCVVIFLQIIIIWTVRVTESREAVSNEASVIDDIEAIKTFRYFLFGAAGVVLFLSVTNVMTAEIAPIPLLWVVPLSIYLLAFVFNFKKFPWCPSWIVQKIHLTLAFSSLLYFFMQQKTFPAIVQLVMFCAALFILCMFCQNQLRIESPRQKQHLTIFYVVVGFGGLVGGLIVSWVIPLISVANIEYLIGLVLISFAITLKEDSIELSRRHVVIIVHLILFLIFWPIIFKHYSFPGLVFIILVVRWIYLELAEVPAAVNLSLIIILCCAPMLENFWVNQNYVYRARNYYGIYKIFENPSFRFFTHGTTLHGAQFLIPGREPEPLTYFSVTSPVGEVLTSKNFQFKQIGIIGLGTGTLSAYLQPEQTLDFFELDRDVYDMAQRYFTFLSHAAGRIRYFFGDARLSLDKIPDSYYDIFIVDAFNGDSIPTHLITQEAIVNMRRHLKKNGIILLHISNRYLQLEPVLAKTAESLNVRASFKFGYPSGFFSASQWAAMTWDEDAYRLLLTEKWHVLPLRDYEHLRAWSDDYSNVLPILKLEDIWYSLKDFQPFHL